MEELNIVKRIRRGQRWVLRFWEPDVTHPYQAQLADPLAEWLDGNCPGWTWKTIMPRNQLGYWGRFDWYKPEIQDGQHVDIIFPDRESMIAFTLRWS
jgi:hypothetical protein